MLRPTQVYRVPEIHQPFQHYTTVKRVTRLRGKGFRHRFYSYRDNLFNHSGLSLQEFGNTPVCLSAAKLGEIMLIKCLPRCIVCDVARTPTKLKRCTNPETARGKYYAHYPDYGINATRPDFLGRFDRIIIWGKRALWARYCQVMAAICDLILPITSQPLSKHSIGKQSSMIQCLEVFYGERKETLDVATRLKRPSLYAVELDKYYYSSTKKFFKRVGQSVSNFFQLVFLRSCRFFCC